MGAQAERVRRGQQHLCEVGQTDWWGLGTRVCLRGEEEEGASLVAMATEG